MNCPLKIQLKREDFLVPTRKALGVLFERMLMAGQLRIVKDQDWRVNRLSPIFIDPHTVGQLFGRDDTILHLGQGDSSACRYFHEVGPRHVSVCYADAIYIDPRTIIAERLRYEFPFRSREQDKRDRDNDRFRVAEIMRDEYLVPAAMIAIAQRDPRALVGFSAKDFEIQRMKAGYLRTMPNNVASEYLASYRALLKLLEKKTQVLIPEITDGKHFRRSISRYGGRLEYTQLSREDSIRLGMLGSDHQCLQPMSPEDVQAVAVTAFHDVCLQPDRIILGNFKEIHTLLPPGETYGLIEGCRSDAFLKHEYAEMLALLVPRLAKGGIYLSDGILSSHKYQFFVREFVSNFLSRVKKGISVWIIISSESDICSSYPPTYIAGLVVAHTEDRIPQIQNMLGKNGRRMVRVSNMKQLLSIDEVRHQIAWTEFVRLAETAGQDLESFRPQELISGLRQIRWRRDRPIRDDLEKLFHDLAT